jgi:hypothetical protein
LKKQALPYGGRCGLIPLSVIRYKSIFASFNLIRRHVLLNRVALTLKTGQ